MPRPKSQEKESKKELTKTDFFFAHGRRKVAVARVRLYKNGGQITINDKSADAYFPGEVAKVFYLRPFKVTNTEGQYSATVKVAGSGKAGQLGAVVHGITRALIVANPEFKPILRKAGLVTRDPRAKERRKFGLAQKARKRKQSPKR